MELLLRYLELLKIICIADFAMNVSYLKITNGQNDYEYHRHHYLAFSHAQRGIQYANSRYRISFLWKYKEVPVLL